MCQNVIQYIDDDKTNKSRIFTEIVACQSDETLAASRYSVVTVACKLLGYWWSTYIYINILYIYLNTLYQQ